jgi:hypothetical protein
MKRAALVILLLVLVVLELLLLEGFLPYGWHHPIYELFQRIFLGQPYAPHPRMDLEIEMVLRQHLSWRIGFYLGAAALAIANGVLILKASSALRKAHSQAAQS